MRENCVWHVEKSSKFLLEIITLVSSENKIGSGKVLVVVVIYILWKVKHAPTEDKDDDIKDSFYEELEQVFDQFPRCHMKILLGDLNTKVGREDIFEPIIDNESLQKPIMITGSE
jgi:hypothetical protein